MQRSAIVSVVRPAGRQGRPAPVGFTSGFEEILPAFGIRPILDWRDVDIPDPLARRILFRRLEVLRVRNEISRDPEAPVPELRRLCVVVPKATLEVPNRPRCFGSTVFVLEDQIFRYQLVQVMEGGTVYQIIDLGSEEVLIDIERRLLLPCVATPAVRRRPIN